MKLLTLLGVQVLADAALLPTDSPEAAKRLASDVMKLHAAALPILPASEKPGPSRGLKSSPGGLKAGPGGSSADAAAEKLASPVDHLPPLAVGGLLSAAFSPAGTR